MKISKKCGLDKVSGQATAETSVNLYQSAIDHIQEAIESLADSAKNDPIAREAIANLGVVLFELK